MKPVNFDYYAPASMEEALDTLAQLGYDGKVLAGGQSLIAAMNFRMARPAALVDLNNISELSYIKPTADNGLAIGTMTRVFTVENSPEVCRRRRAGSRRRGDRRRRPIARAARRCARPGRGAPRRGGARPRPRLVAEQRVLVAAEPLLQRRRRRARAASSGPVAAREEPLPQPLDARGPRGGARRRRCRRGPARAAPPRRRGPAAAPGRGGAAPRVDRVEEQHAQLGVGARLVGSEGA